MSPQSQPNSFEQLHALGVRYVRLTWVDLINFTRYRVIPLSSFKKLLDDASDKTASSHWNPHGGVIITKAALGLVGIALAEGFGAAGEYVYVPDMNSVCRLSRDVASDHVSVMGWFEEKEGQLVKTAGGSERLAFGAELCPRATLKRIVEYVSLCFVFEAN